VVLPRPVPVRGVENHKRHLACKSARIINDSSGTGGKGTPRQKQRRNVARSANDDKKLQATLKKLNTQPIQAIEEVNMFKSDGNVIHFAAPKGMSTPPPPRPTLFWRTRTTATR
jgi:hypothetical protein